MQLLKLSPFYKAPKVFSCLIFFLFSIPVFCEKTSHNSSSSGFIENKGQLVDVYGNPRPDLLFKYNASSGAIFLRRTGFSQVLTRVDAMEEKQNDGEVENAFPVSDDHLQYSSYRLDADFVNANVNSEFLSFNPLVSASNYYLAHCAKGVTEVKNYEKIVQKNIYNNTDVMYYPGNNGSLKYDIVLSRGANPEEIKIKYTGAKNIFLESVAGKGVLKLETDLGVIEEKIPRSYQYINNKIVDVKIEYVLNEDEVSFRIGNYNRDYNLIIDPWVTYLGGTLNDFGWGITCDLNGNVLTTGYTCSVNFPVSTGAYRGTIASAQDAYVAKFDKAGALLWCTYYGGSMIETGHAIATDAFGNVVVAGKTGSNNLPVPGAFQATYGGGIDAFIAKFNSSGGIVWATYLGGMGTESDINSSIAIDGNSDIIVTGYTTNNSFPTLVAGTSLSSISSGGEDVYITKYRANGTKAWGGYWGGSGNERGFGITTDSQNNIVVVGITNSTNFKLLSPHQSTFNGIIDGFISHFTSAGILNWSTYFGGSNPDQPESVCTDKNNGDVIFTGRTLSPNFPVTPGCFQSIKKIGFDVIVVKFNKTGGLKWATFLGGNLEDEGSGIATDSVGNVFVTGDAYSWNFPVTSCAFQTINTGTLFVSPEESFIAKFDPSGNRICSGYIGDLGHDDMDMGEHLALGGGFAYITGKTDGPYLVTPGAFQTTHMGGSGSLNSDAFITQICMNTCGIKNNMTVDFAASQNNICINSPINFTDLTNICDTTDNKYYWTFSGATPSTSTHRNPVGIVYANSGTFAVKLVVETTCGSDSLLKNAYINVAGPSASTSHTDVSCFGFSNGAATIVASGGAGSYSYNWLPTGGTNATASGLTAGNYTVQVTDAIGCTRTDTVVITEPGLLQVNVSVVNNVFCYGENSGVAQASATGGIARYNYQWSSGINGPLATGLNVGTYSIMVTDVNGCTATATALITEPLQLTVTSNVISNVSCAGEANGLATINALGGTPAYFYLWSNGETNSNISNLRAGTYSCVVTDNNSCTAQSSVIISEPTPLAVTYTVSDAHCNLRDGHINTGVSGGVQPYIYNWSNGITNTNNNNVPAGVYQLTVTDNNGCTLTSSIAVSNLNGVTAQVQTITPASCNGVCDGWADVVGVGGIQPYNYNWSNGITLSNASNLCAATYSVTITDASGCSVVQAISITQPLPISASFSVTNLNCYNDFTGGVIVSASGGAGTFTYLWSVSAPNNNAISNLPAGTYSVLVTDANGCSNLFSTAVTEPPQLIANVLSIAPICLGTSAVLNVAAAGGTPLYQYNWSTGATANNISVSPVSTSIYSVTVTDGKGCNHATSTTINVLPLPDITFTTDVIQGCAPLCVNFTNTTSNTHICTWEFAPANIQHGNNVNNCYPHPGSYGIIITVTDTNGCTNSLQVNNYINVHANPTADFTANPQPATINNPLIHFKNKSLLSNSWVWSFGDVPGSVSTLQHPSFNYPDTGNYLACLVAINEFGCTDTTCQTIKIDMDKNFFIPNTFTPNGDNNNDVFMPFGLLPNTENYRFDIFDRWGNKIFTTNNYLVGWDGKANNGNEIAQIDTYVWKITFRDKEERYSYTGHVNLIR